jgi:hypothetical protein
MNKSKSSEGKGIKIGDMVYIKKGLPFGKSGFRKVTDVSLGHSVYVRIKVEESPYKDQDYWQVMWEDIGKIKSFNHPTHH